MTDDAFRPRINHVAISVDATLLDAPGRAALLEFFSEVLGWTEGDNSTEKGNPLILYTGALRQFLYLLPAEEHYLVAPPLDHFGLEVDSTAALMEILERAKAYQRRDDRVRIIDVDTMTTHGPTDDYTLTNAYVGFVLPLMIELQHIQRQSRP
jgi:catechol 2,3-dioxygenase-like lactoylglutathione lyase family enzyme